jgi:hypothetical protein
MPSSVGRGRAPVVVPGQAPALLRWWYRRQAGVPSDDRTAR